MTVSRILPLVLLAALATFLGLNLGRPQQATVRSAMVGKPAPAFALPGLAGEPGLRQADLATGRPVLVNLFASWCLPCRVEAPQLAALRRAGVVIHGIALRDRPEDVAAFLARHGNPFGRIGLDADGRVAVGFGSSGVPETFLIDGQGIIRAQHIGEIRPEDVPKILKELRRWG
ncbi:MAG: DsbE family thiol:disulfide interchange protein [Sphingomonadaceae bacterium]|uniref:DsbE family thiol:disulfide interchange protein n=1 Tax=Thermaurantiacus sp. TaxID=2820283 RepID=UPI00298F0612|nr:DsbE family thiol:disulfide interchange protein [Thermaurantiacus sp.]MCS6986484.1 DsbE family thiol:disulfide interchange protein [Sphingomonadaceae bacterium]MDW8414255.1 DsbE family thiol:disulfide interchange protein [Thermaurantiacus sp.]